MLHLTITLYTSTLYIVLYIHICIHFVKNTQTTLQIVKLSMNLHMLFIQNKYVTIVKLNHTIPK